MKNFIIIIACLSFSTHVLAMNEVSGDGEQIGFKLGNGNTGCGNNEIPKAPVLFPIVYIDGYTLYLYRGCDNAALELYAEDETLAFSTNIETGTSQIILPSTLNGTYELHIIRGSVTFVAEIEL